MIDDDSIAPFQRPLPSFPAPTNAPPPQVPSAPAQPVDLASLQLADIIERGQFRNRLGEAIDRLIDAMDAIDSDHDLEPSLAGFSGSGDDREGDNSDDEETGDEHEPSLGSLGGTANAFWPCQRNWAGGSRSDAEGPEGEDDEDGHDREHDPADDEPSLGSLDAQENQEVWARRGEGVNLHLDMEEQPYLPTAQSEAIIARQRAARRQYGRRGFRVVDR